MATVRGDDRGLSARMGQRYFACTNCTGGVAVCPICDGTVSYERQCHLGRVGSSQNIQVWYLAYEPLAVVPTIEFEICVLLIASLESHGKGISNTDSQIVFINPDQVV